MAFYGRIIVQEPESSGQTPVDEQRFAYPVYVTFLLAPTVHLSFVETQTCALLVLATLTAISVLLWFDTLRWRPPWPIVVAVLLFCCQCPADHTRIAPSPTRLASRLPAGPGCVVRIPESLVDCWRSARLFDDQTPDAVSTAGLVPVLGGG